LIHGLRGTHHGLGLVAQQLTDYRIIIPDLPGFGQSKPLKNEHSVENYVEWLKDFIGSLDLAEKPFLLGHSFGSIIASHYAAKYPKTIQKLILENPIGAPALEGPHKLMTKLSLLYYWLGRNLPEPLGVRLLSGKLFIMIMSNALAKTDDKVLRKLIHQEHLKHFSSYYSRDMLDEAFKASIKHDVSEVARDITVPTLLIAGDIDDITSLEDQRELVKLFPNAKLEVIDTVGHLTHYETPELVAKFTSEFAR
jgi:pimeloyl-ACP methyl ester carboxylesterase